MERMTRPRRTRRALASTGALALALSLLPGAALADNHDNAEARDSDRVCPAPDDAAVPGAPSLTDIEGTTHEDAIVCAVDYGFAQGFGDGTYQPGLAITRGQAASILANVIEVATDEDLVVPAEPAFPDSEAGVHAENINKLSAAGVISGLEDGTFGVGADINRGQMARIVSNTIDYVDTQAVDGSLPAASDVEFFDDAVGSTFQANIQALAAIGVVVGVDEDNYDLGGAVTRGQLASFVMRSADYLDELGRFWPTSEAVEFTVALSGLNEVDDEGATPVFDQGEPMTEATATLLVDPFAGTIDWSVDYDDVTGPFAEAAGFHIHEGGLAENGDIVVFLADGADVEAGVTQAGVDQSLEGTFEEDIDEFRLIELIDDPDAYYLNLHSEDFPAGAVRGQLPTGGQELLEATTFDLTMTGEAEVDMDGQEGASAAATLIVDPVAGTITHTVNFSEVDGPFAEAPGYHIHVGADDENGPVVLFLATGEGLQAAADDDGSIITESVVDADAALLRLLVTDSANYYINLHSDDFPGGAVRAQLE